MRQEHIGFALNINMETLQPTKYERRLLKKQQKREEHQKRQRKHLIKKVAFAATIVVILAGGIFGLIQFSSNKPAGLETKIITKQGIHWHADLSIKILDQYQEISSNIGIGITHLPIHTHDSDGVIHMEFSRLVNEDDIKLRSFFKNWGKNFNKNCIFDKCNGPDGQLKILINDQPNFEFENYVMKDNDKLEIIFN